MAELPVEVEGWESLLQLIVAVIPPSCFWVDVAHVLHCSTLDDRLAAPLYKHDFAHVPNFKVNLDHRHQLINAGTESCLRRPCETTK